MRTPILETERLILRPLVVSDANEIFRNWTSDPEVAKFMRWNLHTDVEVTRGWLEIEEQNVESDQYFTWGFVKKETNELIGSGGLVYQQDLNMFELGYNLMKKYWDMGYTTEAAKEIIRFAQYDLKQNQLFCRHAVENYASGSVIKKLGFIYQKEGSYSSFDHTRTFLTKDYILRKSEG